MNNKKLAAIAISLSLGLGVATGTPQYLYHNLGPEIKINEESKTVDLKRGLFFNKATKAYYNLKGYTVKTHY